MATLPDKHGSYDLLAKGKLDYAGVQFAKWRSRDSGLKVVWADVESPLVHGWFSVATEIFDDTGRPHTLEHLIFMGSEKYPYKGVLDTVANRMMANGTNAWTSTTDTTYTVSTAGAEGFLRFITPFIDHILYPTMTSAGFVTEVHHVNGEGEDSGVVYSEMQGRQNGAPDLMELQLQRTLFPEGSGYRSETGGLMQALRKLTVEQIRDYHKSAYVPWNLTLVVAGRSLAPQDLLSTLQSEVEPLLARHGQAHGARPEGWTRPWVESSTAELPPTIHTDKRERVQFPERDESVGEVSVTWVGPRANDFLTGLALEVLGVYLTESAVSPLYQEFVEVEEPACTDIDFASSTQDPTTITAYLSSVPAERLATLDRDFKSALAKFARQGIDMSRMAAIIERQRLRLLENVETDGAEVMANTVIADALFGKDDGSELQPALDDIQLYAAVATWSADQWIDLLLKWHVNASCIAVIGEPSAKLVDDLKAQEAARIADTKTRLGSEGLAKLARKVEEAQAENDKPIPPEMLRSFHLPDMNGIDWLEVQTARSGILSQDRSAHEGPLQDHIDRDAAELPYFVQFDHIHSHFIEVAVHVFLPAERVSLKTRELLPLYMDIFFSSPMTRSDGSKLSYEEAVTMLNAETISYSIRTLDSMQEDVCITLKVSKDKYATAVTLLHDLLWGLEFSLDRIKVCAAKALQSLPSEKRSGNYVAVSAFRKLVTEANSSSDVQNLFSRDQSLPGLVQALKEDAQHVLEGFEALRQAMTSVGAMRVSVKGDIFGLEQPVSTWSKCFPAGGSFGALEPVILGSHTLNELGRSPTQNVAMYIVPSIESTFAYHICKGPDSRMHPDLAALTVARSVLNAMESFLWKYIRGQGLAYGASVSADVECGFVWLRIFKSPDSYKAFAAAKELVDKLVSNELEIDDLTLESAKSSLAYSAASRESTANDAASTAFINQALLDVPADYNRWMLARCKNVTTAEVLRAIELYIAPLFDPQRSIAGVAVGPSKADEIAANFALAGYKVDKHTMSSDDDDGSSVVSGADTNASA